MSSTSAVEMSIQAVSAGTTAGGGAAAAAGAASWMAARSAAGRSDETTESSGLKVGGDLQSRTDRRAGNISEDIQLNARRQAFVLQFWRRIRAFFGSFRSI